MSIESGAGASRLTLVTLLVIAASVAPPARAAAPVAGPALASDLDSDDLTLESVGNLRRYLRLDTVNPPGNEWRAVEFFAEIFDAEGIPYETLETAPGRGNIWARLEGGDEPAILLLHHTDVVPANARYWSRDPLSGDLHGGFVHGRGAVDTKGLGIIHLQTFLALHRRGEPLRRPVIFMATADEEAGGELGAGFLVRQRPDLFADVGFVLNEGGSGSRNRGRATFSVEVTQKVPLWLRLVATGRPGHGSSPRSDTAVTRLLRALGRLESHEFPTRVVPEVAQYFRALAELERGEVALRFADLQTALAEPDFVARMQAENPRLHALLRDTCSITRFEGSNKINVVPAEAWAELDCRLLPDQDPDRFLAELEGVLGEPGVRIERLLSFTPAVSSPQTELFEAIREVCNGHFPGAVVLPSVVAGFTDSHYFRDLGITSYGFSPVLLAESEAAGIHGNNERLSVVNLRRGVRMMLEVVGRLVY